LPEATKHILKRNQASNQRGPGGKNPPLEKFSPRLEKYVGHSLKLLDAVQKFLAPLRKIFAPPGVPSWLRACTELQLWRRKTWFSQLFQTMF